MSVTVSLPTQYWPATTLRIALKRSSVAASLSTTPRAPSRSASTICACSIATVEHLDRGEALEVTPSQKLKETHTATHPAARPRRRGR